MVTVWDFLRDNKNFADSGKRSGFTIDISNWCWRRLVFHSKSRLVSSIEARTVFLSSDRPTKLFLFEEYLMTKAAFVLQKKTWDRISLFLGSNYGINSSNRKVRRSPSEETPEWIELARLIGIDESEIDHWASQNLQYPAGRVISAWCNYGSPAPTVAELHTVLTSKELRRADLARYIETMYIIQWIVVRKKENINSNFL